MPLTLEQKANVRRHLEFGVAGLPVYSPASGSLGVGTDSYRFLDTMSQLEYRLNRLDANEEARVTGACYGAYACVGPAVVSGITYTVSLALVSGGGATSIAYTSVSGDTQQTVVANLAAGVNQNSTLNTAGFWAISPFGYGAYSGLTGVQTVPVTGNPAIPLAQFAVLNYAPFTPLVVSVTGGVSSLVITASGGHLAPYSTVDPTPPNPVTVYGYLNLLDFLEGAQVASTQNQDTAIADKWYARVDEPEARERLYRQWALKMHRFLFGKVSGVGSFGFGGGGAGIVRGMGI